MIDIIYDEETYPNCFTIFFKSAVDGAEWVYEISDRRNQLEDLMRFVEWMHQYGNVRLVGYNNEGFDYPILHWIIETYYTMGPQAVTVDAIYQLCQTLIFGSQRDKWALQKWPNQRYIEQIDLFKIHHFDNKARSTSLKMLEFQMRADNIEDLPFPPGTVLTDEQKDTLIFYNAHDVRQTLNFYLETLTQIKTREELTEKYGRYCMNDNDTKIGKEYFIAKLEEHTPGICYTRVNGKREKRQTIRQFVALREVILPYVQFIHPEFNRIVNWMKEQVLTPPQIEEYVGDSLKRFETGEYIETKGVFKNVSCTVNGFTFDFGTGGIHGSVDGTVVRSTDTHVVIDLDVASYYPNLAIANRLYPQHLGETFCDIYLDVYNQRKQYPKKSVENGMMKLALNGVYGDSNNKYSPFYDPQYTMSITINGQLLLCMLAEQLMMIDGLQMIQINTDGMTVKVPRTLEHRVKEISTWWENITKLELESVYYSAMYIRDVNNYIAVDTEGNVKRKGQYENVHPRDRRPIGWHQNTSMMVVKKVAERALLDGVDIEQAIRGHNDHMDFCLVVKVPRSSKLFIGDRQVDNITRYVVTHGGDSLIKVMPPTPTQVEKAEEEGRTAPERRMAVPPTKGWHVTGCNNIKDFPDRSQINYDFYIQECRKLVDCIAREL